MMINFINFYIYIVINFNYFYHFLLIIQYSLFIKIFIRVLSKILKKIKYNFSNMILLISIVLFKINTLL